MRTDVAEAHVRDVDVVGRVAVGRQPGQVVDRADEVRPFTRARVVEHLERHESGPAGATPTTPIAVGGRGDDAGDVRPVAVAVLRRPGGHAVAAEADVEVGDEVRVGQVDAGVEDRDADAVTGEAGAGALGWVG